MNAPHWVRSVDEADPTVSTLLQRIERASFSNHSIINDSRKYDPALAATLFGSRVDQSFTMDAGPELSLQDVARSLEGASVSDAAGLGVIMDSHVDSMAEAWRGKLDVLTTKQRLILTSA